MTSTAPSSDEVTTLAAGVAALAAQSVDVIDEFSDSDVDDAIESETDVVVEGSDEVPALATPAAESVVSPARDLTAFAAVTRDPSNSKASSAKAAKRDKIVREDTQTWTRYGWARCSPGGQARSRHVGPVAHVSLLVRRAGTYYRGGATPSHRRKS